MRKKSRGPFRVLLLLIFALFVGLLLADDRTLLEAPAEKSVFGDWGYVIQLAVQTAVGHALERQEKINQDLKEENQALQTELRDLRAEVREKDAALHRVVSETQADVSGKVADLSKDMYQVRSTNNNKGAAVCKCAVSIDLVDDIEGRVEALEMWKESESAKSERVCDVVKKEHDRLHDSHTFLQRDVRMLAIDHNQDKRNALEKDSKVERSARDIEKLKKAVGRLWPLLILARRSNGNWGGAFQEGNATDASREPMTAEQRRELMATARAAGLAMYVLANSNLLNIGGGCNVEEDLVVQGDLTVYGKIYSADAAVYGLPTSTPTASPTPAPTVVRDPDHEFDFRGCTDGMVVVDPYDASINATAKNGATCSEEGMALDGVDDFIDFTTWAFGGATTVEMLVQYSSLNSAGEGALLYFGYSTSSADSFIMHSTSSLAAVINGKFFCPYDTLFWYEGC